LGAPYAFPSLPQPYLEATYENCLSSVLVLYCAISGPTHELSDLSEVILAGVVVVAAVGVVDPPPSPSGGFVPDFNQKR